MTYDDRLHYCPRCKESVPIMEWKLIVAGNGNMLWEHEGEMRGVVSWDPEYPDDRSCGFRTPVPERVS